MATSQISVVMPVYNGQTYLEESINSILCQTYKDFEFIIINDASFDKTYEILQKFSQKDSRIKIYTNEKNLKIAASLNKGIQNSTCSLIARMDADDYAYPNRLEVQFNFMKQNSNIVLCGTAIEEYETGRHITPPCAKNLQIAMLFGNKIFHPTVMFRKNFIQAIGGYSEQCPPIEDYDLWLRLFKKNHTIVNIPQVLLKYRVHPTTSRSKYRLQQRILLNTMYINQLKDINILPTPCELILHRFCESKKPEISFILCKVKNWLNKILKANTLTNVYDKEHFNMYIQDMIHSFVEIKFTHHPLIWMAHYIRYAIFTFCSFAGKTGEIIEQYLLVIVWKFRALAKRVFLR